MNSPPLYQFIGLSYSDPVVQREKDRVTYDLVELSGDRLGFGVDFLGERQVFSSEQVVAMMLTYLKSTTEKAIGKPVKDCVIAVSYLYVCLALPDRMWSHDGSHDHVWCCTVL